MKDSFHRNTGLARPEVLFLLSLVMMAASLAVPALLEWRTYRRTGRTYSEIKTLVASAYQYNREYRLWPVYNVPPSGDAHYGQKLPNAGVMNILSAHDKPGNEHHLGNPGRIDFLAANPGGATLRFNGDGEVVDPWGSPYQMVFDANYDNICSMEEGAFGAVIGEGVAIWSYGPDRISGTEDDLLSWWR